jgi:lipid-binding SYLF domain-containing protein
MSRLSTAFSGLAIGIAVLLANAPAQAADQMTVLDQSVVTVEKMKSDPTFGSSRQILRGARAVLIVPQLIKGGFIFGAEGGDGVLLQRLGRGRWSGLAFYTLGSASFGLQIRLEEARFVMFIMSDRALRAIEQSKLTFGGEAGPTVITLGANAQGATSTNLTGDIIVWASSKGAHGGLTLQGSVLARKNDANAQFYGRPLSVPQILVDEGRNPATQPLRRDLATL